MSKLNHSSEPALTPQVPIEGGLFQSWRRGAAARRARSLLPGPFVSPVLDPINHHPLVEVTITDSLPTSREIEVYELLNKGDTARHTFIGFMGNNAVLGYSQVYTNIRTGLGSKTENAPEPEPSPLSLHEVTRVVRLAQETQQSGTADPMKV